MVLMTMTRHSLDTIRFLSDKAYEYFLASQNCTICCHTLIDKIDILVTIWSLKYNNDKTSNRYA